MPTSVCCWPQPTDGAWSPWLTLHEAAGYLRMTASGVRSLICRGELVPDGADRMRLSDYARSWLRTKLPELKPSTADKYASVLDLHILPVLGDHFIDAIMPADVLQWRDRQAAKPATVNTRLRVLRTLLADAASDVHLIRNPAERTHTVREGRSDEDPNTLSAEQLAKVLAHLEQDEPSWHPLFLTLALTGARFGEVSALHWADIDAHAGVIHIRRAQWKGIEGDTKTGARRTVPLPPLLAKVLEAHRKCFR